MVIHVTAAVIVNPKLTTNSGKPKFTGDDKVAFNINDKIDLLKGIKATDAEDGDITSKIRSRNRLHRGQHRNI